tara:strand:- start:2061 stop:3419 length:1359 start_codon:yes stop_codon:yes gene_type:complete
MKNNNQNAIKKKSSESIKKLLQKKWLVVIVALILTGLGAALTGILFKSGIYKVENYRSNFLRYMPRWVVLPLFGGLGGLISGTLIQNFAPAAKGAGVSQIISFLRHKPVPMGLKVGIVKLFAGIIAIGSGFPLGPEGPAVQMGGSVAWQMAKWLKAPIAFRRVIVAAGGGAGIAAVFSAPIGGFVYAIEELLNSARPVVLLLVVVTTFWADSCADVLQAIGLDQKAGGFIYNLGFQLERAYTPIIEFFPIDFLYLIALGILLGCLAEIYCQYILRMQVNGNKWFKNKSIQRMSLSGLLLGTMYSIIPESFHNIEGLQKIIVNESGNLTLAISIFCILFFSSGLAAASGAPGGLFYPMLTLGGAIGLATGIAVESLTGHVPTTYIFAGMGGFVAGCSRTPITAMFLAFALTKNLLILKPLLITCIASFLTARIFNEHSIYERQIKIEERELIT